MAHRAIFAFEDTLIAIKSGANRKGKTGHDIESSYLFRASHFNAARDEFFGSGR